MEDKRLNEKESLELITNMIKQTKNEPSMKEDYNAFLLYGYLATIISILIGAFIYFTGQPEYSCIWFIMFVPYLWNVFTNKRKDQKVITYLNSMLENIWKVIGSMFGLTVFAIIVIGIIGGKMDFSLMMPLSLIYAGIGTSMTGLVIKEKMFIWCPLIGLFAAVYMLMAEGYDNSWNILFGLSFLIFMVIPAHVCRNKIK